MSLPQPSESFVWTQEPWGSALRCRPLLALAPHLFSSAAVSVSRDSTDPGLASVAASLGLTPADVVQVHQVHGCDVAVCGNGDCPRFRGTAVPETGTVPISTGTVPVSADALVSDHPGRAVGVRVADCAPILIADRTGRAVAAVHGGWRGTAAGVVRAAVAALDGQFDVKPGELVVAIGPSIRACCYEVGPELRQAFLAAGHGEADVRTWFSAGKGDRLQLDVPLATRDQLEALGVPAHQIFDSGLCTGCHDGVFHSYRRSGSHAGRSLALIRAQGSGLRV